MEDECDTRTVNKINDMLEAAATAYATPTTGSFSRIHGYLAHYPARVQKFFAKRPPKVTTLEQIKAYRK